MANSEQDNTVTTQQSAELFELIGSYIDETLTEAGALRLLQLVQADKEAGRSLVLNVLLDLFLKEKSRRFRNIKAEYGQLVLPSFADSTASAVALLQPSHFLADSLAASLADKRNFSEQVLHVDVPVAPTGVKRLQLLAHNALKYPVRILISRKGRRILFRTTAVLLFAALTLTLLYAFMPLLRSASGNAIPTMARVTETIDAVWADNAEVYSRGQLVDESQYHLKSGLVQLEMKNGTTLILEGPGDLIVADPMKAICSSGKISASVPRAARGYEIVTPNGNVVDRGTEFFIDVTNENTQVEVVKGNVDYLSPSKKVISLFADQGLRYNLSGQLENFVRSFANSKYIDTEEFDAKVQQKSEIMLNEKKLADAVVAEDPSLLARFDVTGVRRSKQSEFPNLATRGQSICPDLILKKCKLSGGEWTNTSAILFNQPSGYGVIKLPGSYPSIKITARIQVNRPENEGNVLVASDRFMKEKGAFLVQILKTGEVQLQISSGERNADYYVSPSVITRKRWGTWMDLSVVFDADMKQIRMYLNENCILTERWRQMTPVVCGDLYVGNFINFGGLVSSRHFGGSISQLLIFESAKGR
ncbi:MAG: FecR domain-containing protein [Planctomycetia bacterium]|nr:FecR domain-containing protein [Planctomycetia bacterium]